MAAVLASASGPLVHTVFGPAYGGAAVPLAILGGAGDDDYQGTPGRGAVGGRSVAPRRIVLMRTITKEITGRFSMIHQTMEKKETHPPIERAHSRAKYTRSRNKIYPAGI